MATGSWGDGFPDNRVFRAVIKFTRGGQKCSTGFHLRDLGVAGRTPEEVAEEVETWVRANFRGLLQLSDTIDAVDAVNLVTKEGHTIAITDAPGTVNDDPAPSGLMVPVSLVGGIRARYANGRMLLPVAADGMTNGNVLAVAWATNFNTVLTSLMSTFGPGGSSGEVQLVHLHKAKPIRASTGGSLPAVPATWYDVTAAKLNRTISWLSSRKVGNGV